MSQLKQMLLLGIVIGVGLALLSLIPLFLGQPGWLIGVGIGTAIELINIILLYKGNDMITNANKPFMFILPYTARMALYVVGFIITAIFGFGFMSVQAIPCFYNSIFGVLIAYTPMQIIVVIVMSKTKNEPKEVE